MEEGGEDNVHRRVVAKDEWGVDKKGWKLEGCK